MFLNFTNPHGKNLVLWVRIQFIQKGFQEDNRFYRGHIF